MCWYTFILLELLLCAKISVYFACATVLYFYRILFCFCVYGEFDLFSYVALKKTIYLLVKSGRKNEMKNEMKS